MKRFFSNRILSVVFICACALALSTKPLYAIEDGDIVTISQKTNSIDYYLRPLASMWGGYKLGHSTELELALNCLWIINIHDNGQFSFSNLAVIADDATEVHLNVSATYGSLQMAQNPSAFTLDGTNSTNVIEGTLCYGGSKYISGYSTTTTPASATHLIIEKWELKGAGGGAVEGTFTPQTLDFGFTPTDRNETQTLTFKLKQGGGGYYCVNRGGEVLIDIPAPANIKEKRKAIDLRNIKFAWQSSGTNISKTRCSTLTDSEVKERNMLELSWEKSTTEEDTWDLTVTAIGASPTNIVDANGDWIDYTDQIVATFTTEDETTHRVRANIRREAYHLQEWPTFEVTVSPTSYTYSKTGGPATFEVSCTHQNGADVIKSDGATKAGEIVRAAGVDVTNASTITFVAKSMLDETNVNWLTVESINDGKVTVSASDNSQNTTEREARLVGVITYTDPDDANDTHTETVVIPIKQRVKDGTMTFLPQKGYANTEFGKNPYTHADEQKVHTAEKTIYYLPGEDITLRIAERSFNAYYRWYDYQTGGNPEFNAIASDCTSWATPPIGTLINNDYGDTYGIYREVVGNYAEIVGDLPKIEGWADGKAHIIACDVSNYKDYKISADTIIEPTLSFRQLFHLRPAREMAEKFKASAANHKFVENHEYTAPINQTIYLTTDYRYAGGDESDRSYYYYTNGTDASGGYKCVGKGGITAKWFEVNGDTYTNITPQSYTAKDYLPITVSAVGRKVYELGVDVNNNNKLDDGDVRIARFVVDFVDDCGPSTTPLITRNQILNNYVLLEEIDFSFGAPAPGNTVKYLNDHIPWEQASYGYTYPDVADEPDRNRTSGGSKYIPYYGEYFLTNRVDPSTLSWVNTTTNHGGMENGYALYVDGTSEPGLVASISTDASICSGQTMYCSMWLSNVAKDGTNPVFRCNIQGRKKGDAEWTDVGVFFVGAMTPSQGNWYQINFPVLSDKESYDETRVCIYNFAISAGGNDFMIDDICLYVSPLSLAAYQATMGCRAATNVEEASTAVVVRMDYTQLNPDLEYKWVYYQLNNITDNRIVKLKTLDGEGKVISAYYAENKENISDAFGSVQIPNKDYTPSDAEIVPQLEAHLHTLVDSKTRHSKCYVRDVSDTKWYLYMIHIIPNTQNVVVGEDTDIYLEKNKDYQLVIAHDPVELAKPLCSSTTPIHPTTDTYVELRDTEGSIERVECKDELCANNIYFLNVRVENTFASGIGGGLETMGAQVHADWLIGEATDDAYCHARTMTKEERQKADEDFRGKYGCYRHELRAAISHMRQMPSAEHANPNYKQADVNQLVITEFFNAEELALIQRLCAEGKLSLYKKYVQFYMGSEEIVRYWAYPVAQDTNIVFNGATYPLFDCDEPLWVKVQSSYSEYAVNLSPLDKKDQTHKQRLDIPSIRILEGTSEIVIPIKELLKNTELSLQLSPGKDSVRFTYNEPIPHVLEYVTITDAAIQVVDAPTSLEIGEDYLMRLAFYDEEGNAYIDGDPTECRVGYVYFYLSIVPKTVQWVGGVSNIWGDDGNWRGVKANGSLTSKGFAPLPETNVIIPALGADKPYPIVTTDDHYPMDVNHLPNACNDIYFAPGAMIHNQHLLQYNRAFVDMTITPATWNSMAPPLKGMYTGDMYVPHSGNYSSGTNLEYTQSNNSQYPFVVNSFQGARTSSSAYAFWQSIYNKRVPTYHENGNQSYPAITEDVKFVETNSLGHPLPPGTGYQVLGYGPDNISGDIIVRLPKPDTYYSYYKKDGTPSDQGVSVTHSPKLAFEPDANGDMYITLTNALASNQFMFGNPAMANIDMAKFLEDNKSVLAKKYSVMNKSTWEAYAEATPLGELAPMRSALLELASGTATSVTVKLSKSHFVGYTAPTPASLPARRNSATEESDESMQMTIYATNAGGQARCMVAAKGSASDIYESQEDVLFFSSGVEQGGDGSTATSPINMYTVSKQVPMMVDVRANIDTVPLSMLVLNSYRTEKVRFAFYLSLNWNKECYLWDSMTDEKFRILDGLWLEMDMPENYEARYFILGPDDTTNEDISSSTDRPVLPQVDTPIQLWAYSAQSGQLQVNSNEIIQHVKVYDLTGRLVAQQALDLYGHSMTLSVPTGMCIVEATMRDNTTHYTQAIVR